MCRNIRTLHNFEPPATREEVQAAALQYVRKITGSAKPSQANAAAFEAAVAEVAAATQRLLDGLGFTRMGEVTSLRADGTSRASLVWEMTRADWDARHGKV